MTGDNLDTILDDELNSAIFPVKNKNITYSGECALMLAAKPSYCTPYSIRDGEKAQKRDRGLCLRFCSNLNSNQNLPRHVGPSFA